MKRNLLGVALLFFVALRSDANSSGCEGPLDSNRVKKVGDAIVFTSPRLNVDADGAPNAYRLDGKGLSYTCNGVVAVENGKRVTPTSDPANWQKKCNAAWKQALQSGDYSNVAIFGFQTGKQEPGDRYRRKGTTSHANLQSGGRLSRRLYRRG